MTQETYNYNVEILLLNDDYTWTPIGFLVVQKMEDVGTLVVKCEILDKIENGLKDYDHRFFSVGDIILDRDSIKGVLVKVKEQKD